MNNEVFKKLNSTDTIINAMPRLVEAFVTFYGESERENIQNKFNNMLVIGYCQPKEIEQTINKGLDNISYELLEDFFDKLDIATDERENFKNTFLSNFSFRNFTIQPLYDCSRYINGDKSAYLQRKIVNLLKQDYPHVTEDNIDELLETGKLSDFTKIIELYNETLKQYEEKSKMFEPYLKYVERCKELDNGLKKKYSKKLVYELKNLSMNEEFKRYLFTEEDISKLIEKVGDDYFSLSSLQYINNKAKNIFGYSLNSTALIDAFSKECDEILLNNNSSNWRKDSILNDRIQYFRNLGLDLGDDYELYRNNSQALALVPPSALVEKIISTRKDLNTEMVNEYYQSIEEYKHNMERIEQAGLLDKDFSYNANAYELHSTFVSPNVVNTENGLVSYPMLCLSLDTDDNYLDHNLVHELNHVYELHLDKIEENNYYVTCGWDLIDGKINSSNQQIVSLEKDLDKREYELFNEIINELIAQEILQILFESNGYVFNNEKDGKIKGFSSYENSAFLIREFYNTYKQQIIESRKNGNIDGLFETVGKENFEALNELFHVFYESFPEFTYYKLCEDLHNGIESENTKKYKGIISKRDVILANMEEYSQKKAVSL